MNDLSSAHHFDIVFLQKFLLSNYCTAAHFIKGTSVSEYVGGLNGKVELQDACSVT